MTTNDPSVAVIGIGTRAFVAIPPTTDRVLARDALDSLAPSEGTALGDAVLLSVKLGQRPDSTQSLQQQQQPQDTPGFGGGWLS